MGDVDVKDVPIPCLSVADENSGAGRGIAVVSSWKRCLKTSGKYFAFENGS